MPFFPQLRKFLSYKELQTWYLHSPNPHFINKEIGQEGSSSLPKLHRSGNTWDRPQDSWALVFWLCPLTHQLPLLIELKEVHESISRNPHM